MLIKKSGDYYFRVKAKWPGGYTDTEESSTKYFEASGNSQTGSNPSSGVNTSGWEYNNGVWKYKRTNGTYAASCWEQVNGKWYCFDQNGSMKVSQWVRHTTNEHLWYYVGADGAMVTNTVIDGYTINANGECWN